jgi:hypothetical protein
MFVGTDIPKRKQKKTPPRAAASTAPVPAGPMPLGSAHANANSATLENLRDRTWSLAEEWAQQGWPWLSQVLKGATALGKGER